MVLWLLWRCGLVEDLSHLAPASAAASAPDIFAALLDALVVAFLAAGGAVGPPSADVPCPPATESPCPTAAMAFILSLGKVLEEPME